MDYRRCDVRDAASLERAFRGAEVVVHLAFLVTGMASRETIRAVNVDGTLNAYRAAVEVGAKRFVYASSVAAYGFHADNPTGMTEEWPVRPAAHLFYAQQKAEIEDLLQEEAIAHPELGLYLLRPPIVLGPHAVGRKRIRPAALEWLGRRLTGLAGRLPVPLPMVAPSLPIQFIHEKDVGQAFLLCIVAAGPPGAYNITGDGVLTTTQVARELGLAPIRVPASLAQALARAVAALPFAPPATGWAEAASHPPIIDAGKARSELGWNPRYTSLEALRDSLSPRLGVRPPDSPAHAREEQH